MFGGTAVSRRTRCGRLAPFVATIYFFGLCIGFLLLATRVASAEVFSNCMAWLCEEHTP